MLMHVYISFYFQPLHPKATYLTPQQSITEQLATKIPDQISAFMIDCAIFMRAYSRSCVRSKVRKDFFKGFGLDLISKVRVFRTPKVFDRNSVRSRFFPLHSWRNILLQTHQCDLLTVPSSAAKSHSTAAEFLNYLSFLPSSRYTFPCESVTRIWCQIKTTTST